MSLKNFTNEKNIFLNIADNIQHLVLMYNEKSQFKKTLIKSWTETSCTKYSLPEFL